MKKIAVPSHKQDPVSGVVVNFHRIFSSYCHRFFMINGGLRLIPDLDNPLSVSALTSPILHNTEKISPGTCLFFLSLLF